MARWPLRGRKRYAAARGGDPDASPRSVPRPRRPSNPSSSPQSRVQTLNTRLPPPALALRWHVKDERVKDKHMKDAAQGVAEDVTQDVAEEVLGAAEDGSVKVFVVARAIFQRWNPRPTQACRPHASPWATREGGIKPD